MKSKYFSDTSNEGMKNAISEIKAQIEHEANILRVRAQLMTAEDYNMKKEELVDKKNLLRKMTAEATKIIKANMKKF